MRRYALARFSNACSRSFFFSLKRAEASVFRRRLSSSTSTALVTSFFCFLLAGSESETSGFESSTAAVTLAGRMSAGAAVLNVGRVNACKAGVLSTGASAPVNEARKASRLLGCACRTLLAGVGAGASTGRGVSRPSAFVGDGFDSGVSPEVAMRDVPSNSENKLGLMNEESEAQ